MIVGERLHQLRTARGFTLDDIAKGIGSSKQQVFRIEKGQIPSAETVVKLASFFEVTSDYLLGLVEKPHAHLSPQDLTPEEHRFLNAIRGRSFKDVLDILASIMGDDVSSGGAA